MEVFCEEYFLRKTIFPIGKDIYIPHMVMNYLLFNLLQNFETFIFSMPISRINYMFQITAVFAFLLLWFCISTSAYFCISATADFVLLILTFHLCCCRILPSADYCLSSTADFCMSITADFVFLLLLIVYISTSADFFISASADFLLNLESHSIRGGVELRRSFSPRASLP